MAENMIKQAKEVYEVGLQSTATRDIKEILKEIIIERSKTNSLFEQKCIKKRGIL